VAAAAVAQAAVLTLGSLGYGYHRDELYYRMLPLAWGYVDQPPLTPLLARLTTHLSDEQWALRLPATLAAAASVVVLALIVRELGGNRPAQALASWGYAFAALPLMLGHLLLTSTIDLPLLLLVVLAVLRGVGGENRAWVWGGVVVGVTTYNRLLVAVVVGGLVLGLLLLGPRQPLRTRWPWLGALVALVVGLPNLVYQAAHGWPQLAMGRALSEHNAADLRPQLPVLLLVMLGVPLVAVWVAGIVWLLRRERRGAVGFLTIALAVLVLFAFVSGAQPHYPIHLLSVAFGAGCVPVAAWLAGRPVRLTVALGLLGMNAAISLLLALPVLPVTTVGSTPVADLSPLVRDQVGWPRYVGQIATAYRGAAQPAPTALIASNYGEAGAVARFGGALGLPHPVSGQNGLYELGGPPPGTSTVMVVGYQLDSVRELFTACDVVARLDNGVGVDTEEQGAPVAVCRGPRQPWSVLWPRFKHLD
jgi:4-amino-4-deoxy-L-arabinose transferase-like glycosyltransferase